MGILEKDGFRFPVIYSNIKRTVNPVTRKRQHHMNALSSLLELDKLVYK